MLPSREETLERANELYMKEQARFDLGETTAEMTELKEPGFINTAREQLMCNLPESVVSAMAEYESEKTKKLERKTECLQAKNESLEQQVQMLKEKLAEQPQPPKPEPIKPTPQPAPIIKPKTCTLADKFQTFLEANRADDIIKQFGASATEDNCTFTQLADGHWITSWKLQQWLSENTGYFWNFEACPKSNSITNGDFRFEGIN